MTYAVASPTRELLSVLSAGDEEESSSQPPGSEPVQRENQPTILDAMEHDIYEASVDAEHDMDIGIESIVAGCQREDRYAQRQLYDRCRDRVFRTVLRFVGGGDADDVAQRVFLRVFQRIRLFAGNSSFATWLHRLVVNESLQQLRSRRRRPTQSLGSDLPIIGHDAVKRIDETELVEVSLARLEPNLRLVLVLREFEQLSYEEIALATGLAEGTVASRISRARQRLKEILMRMGWDPGDP